MVLCSKGSESATAALELLPVLELAECIVTVDAMGCQIKIAWETNEAAADYVVALKGSQETVHGGVKAPLDARLGGETRKTAPGHGHAQSGHQPAGTSDRGKGPRLTENRPMLSKPGVELVCGSCQVGGVTLGGHDRNPA